VLRKKIRANVQRIIELFTQKIVTKLSKILVWDPGSEIPDPEKPIPDPGSRIQGSKRHRIPDPGSGSATLVEGSFTSFFKEKKSKRNHKTEVIKVFLTIFA
jgi:hypothetical protein